MVSSVGAHLLDGLKPRRGRRVLPHGTDGWRLGGSLTGFVLLQDERCKADGQLFHDLALRDGLKASLKAQLWSMRSVGALLSGLGAVNLGMASRLGRDGEDGRLNEV